MKIGLILLLVSMGTIYASAYSQNRDITLNATNTSLKDVIKQIEKQSDFTFFYNEDYIDLSQVVSLSAKRKDIVAVLNSLCSQAKLNCKFMENNLVVITSETQQKQSKVSGKVTDQNGQPMYGVTVSIKGTQKAVLTDSNGSFSIEVADKKATLMFSYIGFSTQEHKLTGESIVNIILVPSVQSLDEVVVVGYGQQRKRDVTGATSSVKAEELVKRPLTRLEQVLQGTTPGVQVISPNGMPGIGLSVRIRGTNSLTGSTDPLYVIDGSTGGDISSLDVNDIESMEILKDASATAIYGSRGSNGVVLITTKSGHEGKPQVDFNVWFSKASIAKHLDLMNAYQFAQITNLTNEWKGTTDAFDARALDSLKRNPTGTDWHKALEEKPWIKNYEINVSGGSPNVKYRFSYNYLDQPGLILNQWYKKSTVRANVDLKLNSQMDLKLNMTAVLPQSRNNGYQGDLTDPFAQASIWAPTTPVRDPVTGLYNRNSTYGSAGFNPVAQASNQIDDYSSTNLIGTGVFTYRIFKGLTFTSNNTFQTSNSLSQSLRSPDTGVDSPQQAYAQGNTNKSRFYQNSNYLNYNGRFGKHEITLTALYEQQNYQSSNINSRSANLSTYSLGYYNLGLGASQSIQSGYSADALQSYMGRVNYTFNDKYLLTASIRTDGSSHLTQKYSTFPSVAVGWNLGKEKFVENWKIFSTLKIRAGYGLTGNQAVGAYATIPQIAINTGHPAYYFDGNTPTVGTQLQTPVSQSLKWETTAQSDIGLDASFFEGRLTFNGDAYYKKVSDLLYNYQAPFYLGGGSYQRNMGSLENKGLEFALSGIPVSNNKIKWTSSFTISFNRNKVLSLDGLDNVAVNGIGSAQGGISLLKVGKPLGEFYGYKFLGTWKTSEATEAAAFSMHPGDAKFLDVNNDKQYTSADYLPIGNGTPKFSYGFINDVIYGNFTLSVMIQGMSGNQIYSQTMGYVWGGQGQAKQPTTVDALHMWTPTKQTDNPDITPTSKIWLNSSRYVYNGSYAKLKNLSISYHIPADILKKAKIRSFEVYVSGQNLFTITKYPGYDPEATNSVNSAYPALTQGVEMGAIPNPRTYTIGFRAGF